MSELVIQIARFRGIVSSIQRYPRFRSVRGISISTLIQDSTGKEKGLPTFLVTLMPHRSSAARMSPRTQVLNSIRCRTGLAGGQA